MAFFGRGPNRVQEPYTLKHVYSFYKNEVEGSRIYDLEYSEYVDITTDFYKEII